MALKALQKSIKRLLGASAEKLAEDYLKEKGYEILARNFRSPFGEIDLVVKKGKTLVFVEVKSGGSLKGHPEERVDRKKQERIQKIGEYFLLKNFENLSKIKEVRFDVIAVDSEKGEIRHYESAFFAEN